MDLELAKRMAAQYYLYFKLQGVEQDRLDLIIRFIEQAKAILERGQPAPAANPMATAMGGPAMQPAAMPGSPVAPQVPPPMGAAPMPAPAAPMA
jgi:hypothetical protein